MDISKVMDGKKTITSCVCIAVVGVLQYLNVIDNGMADILMKMFTATGLYGVYDRITRQ